MCARCPARPGPGCGTGRSGRQVAGPVGGSVEGSAGDPVPGVFCCGLRVVSMDGSTSDVRETAENSEYFSRPPDGCRARGVSSGPLAGCSGVGDRGADRGELWPVHGRGADPRAIAGRTGCITARRGRQLLDGVPDPASWVDAGQGRRWRPPNISSLSRARARFGADPLHMLFEQVAGLLITRPSPQLRPRNSHRASTKYTHQPGQQQPATDLPGVGHLHPPRIHQLRRERPGQRPHRHPIRQPPPVTPLPTPSCATTRLSRQAITRSGTRTGVWPLRST
jgi:hypothetical protein